MREYLSRGAWTFIILYSLLVVALGLLAGFWEPFASWLRDWSRVVGFIVTGFLTVGLIVLYDQQKELQKAEYEPVVWLEGMGIRRAPLNSDNIYFQLSNVGEGVALDLRTETDVTFPKQDAPPVILKTKEESLDNIKEGQKDLIPSGDTYLYPNTKHEMFRVGAVVLIKTEEGEYVRRTLKALRRILANEVDYMRVKFTIRYEDKVGESYSKEVIDEIWPVEEDYSLNQMMIEGRSTDDEDPYESIGGTNTRRMLGADEETMQEGYSPVHGLFFKGELDEERIEIVHHDDGIGTSFHIELDEDYREELKQELAERGIRDDRFFDYGEEDVSYSNSEETT